MVRKKKESTPRLSEAEIFAAAKEYEEAAEGEARFKKVKETAKRTLVDQIHRLRGVKALESDKYGEFTRITIVQNESIQYHEDDLYKDLTVAQRRLAYDRQVNLNALPAETRKKILEAVPKDELKAVTRTVLNVERLSQAVQSGKIPAKVVAEHSEIVKSAPYCRISHGTGE